MQHHIDKSQVQSASASLHAGGVLSGAVSNVIYSYLERETSLTIPQLFPSGLIASSVNSIAAVSFGLGYSADEYNEMFDRGANAFSPPHVDRPSNVQIIRQIKSIIAHSISSRMFDRICPQTLRDLAQNPLMDTAAFDSILYEYLNGHKLKDLDISVIISAGLITDDVRHITQEFSRIARNGYVEFSDPQHEDVSLIDIVKGSSAIPGVLKGHYIPSLKQMFNDNGHVMDITHSTLKLHSANEPSTHPIHVCIGRVNYNLDESITAIQSYNKHHILDHLRKGAYKTTTCAHNFNNQLKTLRHIFGNDQVIDLSIYLDPKTHPSDLIPIDDMLLNSDEQRRRIRELVAFEIDRHHDIYTQLVDTLGENALRIQRFRETGSYESRQPQLPTISIPQNKGWWSRATIGLAGLITRGTKQSPSAALN
jgi:patatin-like phospholipase/acyl hydrolase